ncbi:major facilitator superfamily domain-containing protein [Russula aff. rugulosa BPL654]|nr:major facilitator superfamily domain-containing protein [Russula aff. rugulosa BPL654]
MSPRSSQDTVDEETPLLHNANAPRKATPLPVTQISILLLLLLAEPITSLSINPYINQLVSELSIVGGDERKVGYYAGILVSLYFAAEAATILQWSRLSDYIGRKPVLLFGLLGTIISIILFGLSRSFWALVFSRCLNGMLNGNIGVIKSMLAELTDETNMARGFSLIPVIWALGGTIGPLIGGVLSRPQDRWPNAFSHPFWAEFPYFLPCVGTATYTLLSFILTALFLKETVPSAPLTKLNPMEARAGEIMDGSKDEDEEKPMSLRDLLTRPVVISIANYGLIGLLEMIAGVLIPLVWSTPVEFGGLSMSPASIGLWMAGYGLLNGIFQFVAFPHIVERFGPRCVFIVSISSFAPMYLMLFFENLTMRHIYGGASLTVLLIILQLSSIAIADMGFSSVFMYVSSSAPSRRSLGATNGLAQTIVSIQRTVAPAAAASLFAFSLNNNVLGGNFTYVVLTALVCVGLCIAAQLPKNTWKPAQK